MSKYYSLAIESEYISILQVEKKTKGFTVLSSQTVELSELSSYIDKKDTILINFDQEYVIDELIEVPSIIKSKATVKNYILHRLKKSAPKIDILFKHKKLEIQKDKENTIYQVDGVDEIAYSKSLEVIENWNNIQSATLSKFALFNLSSQCLESPTYISVYSSGNKLVVIAVQNRELLFSRTIVVNSSTPEALKMDMAADINQTLSYIQQQHRDAKFSTLLLSGSLALDDVVSEQLLMLNSIPVAILYPNTFINGIENEEAHEYILSLGNLFVPKDLKFFPSKLLALKEFNIASNIILLASSLLVSAAFYLTFSEYRNYSQHLQRYDTIKGKLINTVKETKTLSIEDLDTSYEYLTIAKKYLINNPSDIAIDLKPIISLLKPMSWKWQHENDILTLNATFIKEFQTLEELHYFQQLFDKTLQDINSTVNFQQKQAIEYSNLLFKTHVIIEPITRNIVQKRARVE